MSTSEAQLLAYIRAALDHHAKTCPMPARAILLNPVSHEEFGWDELWGVPVVADERVQPKRFRIDCDGSAFGIEEALEEFASEPAREPLVTPSSPPRVGEPHARR